jgi:hypothetical protein
MADVGQRDRTPQLLELTKLPWPAPPLNLFMLDGTRGVIDLRWDDPAILTLNSRFHLLGVNVYRSFDSEFGPYERITDLPIGSTFWRDQTDNELIVEEDVTDKFILFGDCSASGGDVPRYVFKTLHQPIVAEGSRNIPTNNTRDVWVYVDGVQVRVLKVFGNTGEVEIDSNTYTDVGRQQLIKPVLPTQQSRVTCTYRYPRSFLRTDLSQRIFYRVTTVGVPTGCNLSLVTPQDLIETPLEHAAATNTFETEKLDYIWREAIRRNRWILQQGGERVSVFLRKNVGLPCPCVSFHHKQAQADCLSCFGTMIVGGYEGPYEIIVAPDDAETAIRQTEHGRTTVHTYEVWTGPTPLLSQRDFILKINGDRYSIGPVRMPSNRGNLLQQHFSIGSFDDKDIRYKVLAGDPIKYAATQFGPSGPELEAGRDITDKPGIGDERELRGRTKAWENTNYGILLLVGYSLLEVAYAVSRFV